MMKQNLEDTKCKIDVIEKAIHQFWSSFITMKKKGGLDQSYKSDSMQVSHGVSKFTGVAIVVLKTQKAQKELIQYSKKNSLISYFKKLFCLWCCSDEQSELSFERAPEPTDIFWENMNVTPRMRNMKIATVFLATLALIVACFFSLYALDKVKRQYDS